MSQLRTVFFVFALFELLTLSVRMQYRQWRSHGGGLGVTIPPPIEPQVTSYIIETVRTKCIIGEALKVRCQNYDKLSLKIIQKALKWSLQYANF